MAQNASLLRNVDWNNRTDGCLCTQTCVLFLYLHPGHGAVLAGDHGVQEESVPPDCFGTGRKEITTGTPETVYCQLGTCESRR